MPATSSGADAGNGSARNREHNQGNQDRKCTPEQVAAVMRIRRCEATAFYEILDVHKTGTDSEVKKAYRKQSLLTHPDKNGHEHADEAFKMVSRAFSVLGDKEKRAKYDKFGTDPDSRFGGGGGGGGGDARGFGGGGGFPGGGMPNFGGGGFQGEISPEEMFRRFFGGGGAFGGPFGFDTGPQFVFNMGGGPGIRVHQFGGRRPRTRPRNANPNNANAAAAGGGDDDSSTISTLLGLLPILFLFILPLLSSLFTSDSTPAMPSMVFDAPQAPWTLGRQTQSSKVRYFVDPKDKVFAAYKDNPQKLAQLDSFAEVTLVRTLQNQCEREMQQRQRLVDEAQGWIFQDADKMEVATNFDMKACRRLDRMNKAR